MRDERSCQAHCLDGLIRSRAALEVEIWMLRQQINVLRRAAPKKQTFTSIDRLIFACLYRLRPGWRCAGDCQAGDRSQMASRWLPFILAMEIERAGWPANSSVGDRQAYPRDKHCQSADIPSQSRGWDRCDKYVRRANNLVSPALWIADHEARPATYSMVWRHSASNR